MQLAKRKTKGVFTEVKRRNRHTDPMGHRAANVTNERSPGKANQTPELLPAGCCGICGDPPPRRAGRGVCTEGTRARSSPARGRAASCGALRAAKVLARASEAFRERPALSFLPFSSGQGLSPTQAPTRDRPAAPSGKPLGAAGSVPGGPGAWRGAPGRHLRDRPRPGRRTTPRRGGPPGSSAPRGWAQAAGAGEQGGRSHRQRQEARWAWADLGSRLGGAWGCGDGCGGRGWGTRLRNILS